MKQLIREIHRRSLWQVLAIYLASSWVVFEVIQTLTEGVGLPDWLPSLALVLLLIGLPIVLATAFVQERAPAVRDLDPTLLPGSRRYAEAERGDTEPAGGVRKLFTWRNAIMGGVLAFALWGVVAAGWLLFSGGDEEGSVPTAAVADTARKMLVVLPFENLGPPEDEYFADGLTEEITARLAGIGVDRLGVIARTSAIRYKDTDRGIREIGRELDVDYVLEGTVRWQRTPGQDRVRVTPQLIRVSDASHLWAEVYDQVLSEIFEVQSRIASNVVDALEITLLEPESRRLNAKPTEDIEAYDYYLRGNDYVGRGVTRSNLELAAEMYREAIDRDPGFALAYARLSLVHGFFHWFYFDRSQERLRRAKQAVDRAFELDPDLPEAHLALGDYHYRRLDYGRALEELSIARARLPNSADVIATMGFVSRRQGEWVQSLEYLTEALELDPLSSSRALQLGISYFYMRRFGDAERLFDRAERVAPDEPRSYVWRARLYVGWEGDTSRARQTLEERRRRARGDELDAQVWWHWALLRILEPDPAELLRRLNAVEPDSSFDHLARGEAFAMLEEEDRSRAAYEAARELLESRVAELPDEPRFHAELGLAYAGLGRHEEAIREGERAVELQPVSKEAFLGTDWLRMLARIYVRAGEPDRAIESLERALAVPSALTPEWLRLDPIWAPLRSHPGFQELVERPPAVF